MKNLPEWYLGLSNTKFISAGLLVVSVAYLPVPALWKEVTTILNVSWDEMELTNNCNFLLAQFQHSAQFQHGAQIQHVQEICYIQEKR